MDHDLYPDLYFKRHADSYSNIYLYRDKYADIYNNSNMEHYTDIYNIADPVGDK